MSYLTDTEKRLLFSALKREKDICKKIDDIKVDDGTCKMLVPVVKSLESKFYYDRYEKEIRSQVIDEVRNMLHELGGTGAQDEWTKGWDDAITAAIGELDGMRDENPGGNTDD